MTDTTLAADANAPAAIPTKASSPVYDDGAVRMFTLAAVLWGIVGMSVGVVIASQLTWPELEPAQLRHDGCTILLHPRRRLALHLADIVHDPG